MQKDLMNKREIDRKKGPCGIMFSDMECTLIGGGKEKLETWELYEEACKKVSALIDMILSFNNYFVIVSSSHHDAKERVARKFSFIYNNLSLENRDKIKFFISDTGDNKNTDWEYEDILVKLIGEKVECVDIALTDLADKGIEINTIVGMGDDEKDVDMLFRIQELGGSVATIAEKESYLTNCFSFPEINESTYKDVIKRIVDEEYHIDQNILISNLIKQQKGDNFGSFMSFVKDSPQLIEIQEKQKIRTDELISLYECGEVDNEYLQKCLYNAELAYRYFYYYCYNVECNVGYGEDVLRKISDISSYHANKALSSSEKVLELPKIKQLLMSKNSSVDGD